MLRTLIAVPILVVLVLFALSNTQPVVLTLWPLDYKFVPVPIAAAILGGMAIAFVLGALFVWFPSLAARSRARRYERATRKLEAQVTALKKKDAPRTAVAAR